MGAREARKKDDWQNDEENPLVPFRMSDRLTLYGVELKVNIIVGVTLALAGLVGAGMVLHFA